MNSEVKVIIAGGVDSSKCLAKDTNVMLYGGSLKLVQDLIVGDLLMGDDNTPRRVLSTTNGFGQLYKISQNKGEPYYVNGNHILSLKSSNYETVVWNEDGKRWRVIWIISGFKFRSKSFSTITKKKTKDEAYSEAVNYLKNVVPGLEDYVPKGTVVDISVKDYLNLSKKRKEPYKGFKTDIDFPVKNVSTDPYILGYWLGDGTSSKPQITTADSEIVDIFTKYADEIGARIHKTGSTKYNYDITTVEGKVKGNKMRNSLKEYNLFNNKHIPTDYKYTSRANRLKLLAGLLDSDGCYTKNNTFSFSQKSERLFDDTLWLVRSLGFSAQKVKFTGNCVKPDGTNVPGLYYRMDISGQLQEIPTQIKRKQSAPRVSPKDPLVTRITVSEFQVGEYFGFELDGNKRFLLEDFTVTHNSSTLGCLVSGELDDGRGKSRTQIFKHPHERQSGRTSDISQHIVGFDSNGMIVNRPKMEWADITKNSSKIITFFDLAGHEKYLKTTIRGLSFANPDYAIITVGANMGINPMTKEHIGLCTILNIPFCVLITKIDLCDDRREVLASTLFDIQKIVRNIRRKHLVIKTEQDLEITQQYLYENKLVPIFLISNVSGKGLDLLHKFLYMTPVNNKKEEVQQTFYDEVEEKKFVPKVFLMIESIFNVKGIGQVVGGELETGIIRTGDSLYIGPDFKGNYHNIIVKSIHIKRSIVSIAYPRTYVCVGIKKNDELRYVRKGMVVVSEDNQIVVNQIKVNTTIIHHSTTIKVGYQPTVYILGIRQTCQIMDIQNKNTTSIRSKLIKSKNEVGEEDNSKTLRSGDTADIIMKFIIKPEHVICGMKVILAEGRTRAVGTIVEIN